jgi:hypothetical protein
MSTPFGCNSASENSWRLRHGVAFTRVQSRSEGLKKVKLRSFLANGAAVLGLVAALSAHRLRVRAGAGSWRGKRIARIAFEPGCCVDQGGHLRGGRRLVLQNEAPHRLFIGGSHSLTLDVKKREFRFHCDSYKLTFLGSLGFILRVWPAA